MIVLIPIAILLVGFLLWDRFSQFSLLDTISLLLIIIGGVSGFVLLLWMMVARIETATIDLQREALQDTYNGSRELSEFERVSITRDIAKFNMELAINKKWNNTWMFDWFIDDVIKTVEPIQ